MDSFIDFFTSLLNKIIILRDLDTLVFDGMEIDNEIVVFSNFYENKDNISYFLHNLCNFYYYNKLIYTNNINLLSKNVKKQIFLLITGNDFFVADCKAITNLQELYEFFDFLLYNDKILNQFINSITQ